MGDESPPLTTPHWWPRIAALVLALTVVIYLVTQVAGPKHWGFTDVLGAGLVLKLGFFGVRGPRSRQDLVLTSAAVGGLWLGGLGFAGGFFGPMYFSPESNQGPMLGIFITGPGGLLLGLLLGTLHGVKSSRETSGD